MIAYKFLAPGAVAPFTRFAWPVPGPGGAGAWVEAPSGRAAHGIHACRAEDLAFWLDAELWRAELAGPLVEGQRQVVGARGRLLERVAGWDAQMARRFAEACLWLARDRAVDALGAAGPDGQAALLAGCRLLPDLHATARELAPRPGLAGALAGYLAEAIDFLQAGDPECAAYICARSAVVAAGGAEVEFGAERERQARWLAERLGLQDPPGVDGRDRRR